MVSIQRLDWIQQQLRLGYGISCHTSFHDIQNRTKITIRLSSGRSVASPFIIKILGELRMACCSPTCRVNDSGHKHSSGDSVITFYVVHVVNTSAGSDVVAPMLSVPAAMSDISPPDCLEAISFTGQWFPLDHIDLPTLQRPRKDHRSHPDFSGISRPMTLTTCSWHGIHDRFRQRGPIVQALTQLRLRANAYKAELSVVLGRGRGPDLTYAALLDLCMSYFQGVLRDVQKSAPASIHSLLAEFAEHEARLMAGFAITFPLVCAGDSDIIGSSQDK
eukprot:TRINITY_DN21213_c0_g1_i1.p1 TRINITY_DN21213_c0_g1~~TRINITY_DN21213_c0_g1_i1.p1  ORF type:complete len:307 (-),score=4.83 TRINITY_DN21213_c0_g1_i1:1136-1963(-)